jgi:hypothetical protein
MTHLFLGTVQADVFLGPGKFKAAVDSEIYTQTRSIVWECLV